MKTQIYKPVITAFGGIEENNIGIMDPSDTGEVIKSIEHLLVDVPSDAVISLDEEVVENDYSTITVDVGGEELLRLIWLEER